MTLVTAGLDEAGRGPLAGPVAAGCVVLPEGFPREVLADSKTLSARQRDRAYALILEHAAWGLGWSDAGEIDQINILRASLLAMSRAYEDLLARFPEVHPDRALADGLYCPKLAVPCEALVRGDSREPCISAASIVAKVARDLFMDQAHQADPRYGFAVHKGYPTAAHRKALAEFGPGPLHRLTFAWKRPRDDE